MTELKESFTRNQRMALLLVSQTGFLLAFVVGPLLLKYLGPEMSAAESALNVAGNILAASTMAIFLCVAILVARERGFTPKRSARIAVFTLLPVILIALSWWMMQMTDRVASFTKGSLTREMVLERLSAAPAMEKKARLSWLYATIVYEEDGRIVTHLRPDGTEVRYVPDRKAVKNREMMAVVKRSLVLQKRTFLARVVIWLVTTLVGACVGMTRKRGGIDANHH